jgi:hypothetical protein
MLADTEGVLQAIVRRCLELHWAFSAKNTVSETVSENSKTVRKNSGELERFLLETSMK